MPLQNRLVGAEVGELEVDAEVSAAELAHDLLEDVAVFADDADGVALDGGLGLELGVLDGGDDLLGVFGGDALLELDLLADGGVGGGLDLFVLEVLEGDAALDELLREDLDDGFERVLVLVASWMASVPSRSILDLESLRSKRAWTSLEAWSMAFFTS